MAFLSSGSGFYRVCQAADTAALKSIMIGCMSFTVYIAGPGPWPFEGYHMVFKGKAPEYSFMKGFMMLLECERCCVNSW